MTKWRFADVKETPKIREKWVGNEGSDLQSEILFQKRHRSVPFQDWGYSSAKYMLSMQKALGPKQCSYCQKALGVTCCSSISPPLWLSTSSLPPPAMACRRPPCLLHGHWALHSKCYPLGHLSSPNLDFVMQFSRRSRTFLSLVCCVCVHVYMCEHMCSMARVWWTG